MFVYLLFILPTDRPIYFDDLPVEQQINLVSPHVKYNCLGNVRIN